jgi:hypothetical protein
LGEQTSDEMFLISFQSLPYRPGDELYNIEEMLNFTSSTNKSVSEQIHLVVFPNPSKGHVEITGWQQTNNELTQIMVTDMLGKIVLNEKINADNGMLKINIENISNGIYFISLQSGHNKAFQKVIITGN